MLLIFNEKRPIYQHIMISVLKNELFRGLEKVEFFALTVYFKTNKDRVYKGIFFKHTFVNTLLIHTNQFIFRNGMKGRGA